MGRVTTGTHDAIMGGVPRHDEALAGFRSSADEHARRDQHRERLGRLEDRKGELVCTTCGERAVINTGGTRAHHLWVDWAARSRANRGHLVTLTHGALREHLAAPIAAGLIDLDKIRGLTIVGGGLLAS